MASPLYEPINVYKPLAPDIGIVDGPLEYLTVGGVRLPLPLYDQDDRGTSLERRTVPSFAHHVRSRDGRGVTGVRDSSASRVSQSIPLRPYRRVAKSLPGSDRLG